MRLNPSIKHHLVIGALLCIWAFIFSFFARPFEHGVMDLQVWIRVSTGFSLITFIAYAFISIIQLFLFSKLSKWTIGLEIAMYVLFFSIYTGLTFYYYISPIIRGIYDFQEFFREIILNIIFIVSPLIMVGRHYVLRFIPKDKEEIIIKGTNKLDYLKIKQADLVCISNAQNYVEIFFLEEDELKTKLIRSSLKNVHSDLGFLIQIHRSHLINPEHFKSWKDSSTILLTQKELPVSKTYKNNLLAI